MGPGALETALALYQSPSLAAATRQRPVPDDVFEVIRIASGEVEAIDAAVARSGCPAPVVCEAAQLYLKHVLFDPDADHYRVLGVAADADEAQMREHRRWLLKWLHPDRADEWDAVYAARVQQAWQQLRDPLRRAGYDQSLADGDDWAPATGAGALRPVWTARALAADEVVAPERRSGAGLAVVAVTLLAVVGLGWAIWPAADGPRPATDGVSQTPSPQAGGPYVLEWVPTSLPAAEPGRRRTPPVDATAQTLSRAPPEPSRQTPVVATSVAPSAAVQTPIAPEPAEPEPDAPEPLAPEPVASAPITPAPKVDPPRSDAPAVAIAEPVASFTGTASARAEPAPRIDADAVAAAMAAFQAAYERGDIEALMGVFTQDARNRRGGREAIRQDYTRLFRSSRQRRLQWHSLDWQQGPDTAVGEGGFVASITPRRGVTNTVRGRVRVEVVQRGRQVRIRELWHEDGVP